MSKDKDHRAVADHILKTAHKVVTTERGNQHGGAEDSFAMIAALWQVYLQNTNNVNHQNPVVVFITAKDVAMMMDLMKTARHVHGDPTNEDNFVDKAGYTSLAAALAGIPTPEKTMDHLAMRAVAKTLAPEGQAGVPIAKHTEIATSK